jgi:hypothetical protein
VGKRPWGYQNWKDNPTYETELKCVDTTNLIFRSTYDNPASVIQPVGPEDGDSYAVVQYHVWAEYKSKDASEGQEPTSYSLSASDWVLPEWYWPMDFNVEYGLGLEENFSAFTILDTISPGRAWFNEVNYNNLTKEQLDMDGERVLKSNNGILMLGEAGKAYDLVAHPGRQASGSAISTDDAKDYGTNLLVPVIVPTHFEPADYYVLKNGQFCAIEDKDSKTPACKAVLKKPAGAALARVLNIVAGSGVTAVFDLNDNGEMINDNWYDLNGRKLDEKPTKKGLYIKNGKKVVMK